MSSIKSLSFQVGLSVHSVVYSSILRSKNNLATAVFNLCNQLALAIILLMSFAAALSAQTNQLSGTLNLPLGVVPTNQDLVFRIQTEQLDEFELEGMTVSSATEVRIPVLATGASFSVPLLDFPEVGLEEAQRRIKFDCIMGCSNIAITTTGYWGGIQGVVSQNDAQVVDSALAQSITIDLERADFFRGVINFPDGIEASGNEVFDINVAGSQFSNPPTFTQTINALEGQTNLSFFIGVPPGQTGGSWLLSLECSGCSETIPVGPYFPTTSAGDPLSTSVGDRFFHLKNRSYSNLRFTLPSPIPEPIQPSLLPAVLSILLNDE